MNTQLSNNAPLETKAYDPNRTCVLILPTQAVPPIYLLSTSILHCPCCATTRRPLVESQHNVFTYLIFHQVIPLSFRSGRQAISLASGTVGGSRKVRWSVVRICIDLYGIPRYMSDHQHLDVMVKFYITVILSMKRVYMIQVFDAIMSSAVRESDLAC